MPPLYVAFLWHMHQPYYKDPASGEYILPWVRCHATRGYTDMAAVLADFPDVHLTFNLVPSLLVQLEEYGAGATDRFLTLSAKPAEEVTDEERIFMADNFFMANHETMVDPYVRYRELLGRRGQEDEWTEQEIRDLQVWWNLTWFGFTLRQDPAIAALFAKGRGFDEDEKGVLFERQAKAVREVVTLYRDLAARGQAELSTSPFFHPILPLLFDLELARVSLPEAALPRTAYKHPEDARTQLVRAIDYHGRLFGTPPRGLWPPEGAVSPEVAALAGEAGLAWMASDQDILLRSEREGADDNELYAFHRLDTPDGPVSIVFRDRLLSDLIGFSYARNDPRTAVDDFVGRLRGIRQRAGSGGHPPLVAIVLDGENPWEYYPDGGKDFLRFLYEAISRDPGLRAVTMSEYLAEHGPSRTVRRLFAGSWIGHSFDTWIGGREENIAWEVLSETRDRLAARIDSDGSLAAELIEKAWQEIYIAEASDWFWWYGKDHASYSESTFDVLFRSRLSEVYRLIGLEPPAHLMVPIAREGMARPQREPTTLIHPKLEGLDTSYYEWNLSGLYAVPVREGTMHRSAVVVRRIYYGFDLRNLYLRIDANQDMALLRDEGVGFAVYVLGRSEFRLELSLSSPRVRLLELSADGVPRAEREVGKVGVHEILELYVHFSDLELEPGDEAKLIVTAERELLELERWPREGYIRFHVPGPDFEVAHWRA
jgi:alpha-amylase/alpha-mannosidase (GH57 family)